MRNWVFSPSSLLSFLDFSISSLRYSLLFLSIMLSSFIYAQDKPKIKVGGALRFNYHYDTWRPELKDQGGEFVYDMIRINPQASWKDVYVNAEYRFYSDEFGGSYLKQGWIGYYINDKSELQLGLTQVPFGIQQYNSHNWFFNIAYYVGLEDDHDIGLKYIHSADNGLTYQFAFFKNAEYTGFAGGESSWNRYSYDVTSFVGGEYRNKELNTVVAKVEYAFGENKEHTIGASGRAGQIYNFDTGRNGGSYAGEFHYQYKEGPWSIKSQFLSYSKSPQAPTGEADNVVAMGAYGFPYLVAAQANIYTAAIAYSVPVEWGPISNLQFYNDFGYLQKIEESFEDSYMNVTGVLVTAGHLYTYIDAALGKNHSWVGGNFVDDFAQGNPNANWEMRFNINFGYYF